MTEPFVGPFLRVGFNFEPLEWACYNGRLLPVTQYSALLSLPGTTRGRDGQTLVCPVMDPAGKVARQ